MTGHSPAAEAASWAPREIQEIELAGDANLIKQTVYTARRFAQASCQALRIGQRADRATQTFSHALVIPVGNSEIGAHLGHQQAIQVIATPDGQHRQHQGQDDAERQQGEQQQAAADRTAGGSAGTPAAQ
jgi:hypothetical protein